MPALTADLVRQTPAYSVTEAAHYLRLPATTLRAWCTGQDYRVKGLTKRYQRVIRLDGRGREGLSFLNLVEAHVPADFDAFTTYRCPRSGVPLSGLVSS
jgi:hypothetical protein